MRSRSGTGTPPPCISGGRDDRSPHAAPCCSRSLSMTRRRIRSKFPTEEEQKAERERLHGIISRLVVWENIHDEKLLREAHEEILKSTGGNPPPILDPFAGGGSIPLEAQRLGLEAHASDLNPVAVLINKALIEIPPKWAGHAPVFPGAACGTAVLARRDGSRRGRAPLRQVDA